MSQPVYILGISAYYHDSAAALLKDGEIVAAAQEERFTRKKHDPDFPARAVRYVLDEAGIELDELDGIAFYDKPFLKFERLLETYHAFAPKGFVSFLTAMPVWIKEKLFMRSMLEKSLREVASGAHGGQGVESGKKTLPPLYFPEHHLSHAASAFYPSPFEEAAVVTLDGVGEWATTSICRGRGNSLEVLREIHFPHSLGLLYSAFTAYCGFKVNSGEYKLMGLAPYGTPGSERVREFENKIRENLVDIKPDGSYTLNMDYFSYATGFRMYDEGRWQRLFGIAPRTAEGEDIPQEYMDMALAIQNVTEEIVLTIARSAREITGCRNLCLAGGVALNCVANGKILEAGIYDDIWVQPASGDAGGALGAALALWHIGREKPRQPLLPDSMRGSYLGPIFSRSDVESTARRMKAPCTVFDDEQALFDVVTDHIADGKVVGWFQGRMEYGPRALGNRSILGDPRNPEMQKRLNLKIKYREGFRPFAPSVLEEDCKEYFKLANVSPYMLLVAPVADALRNALPDNYEELPLWDRLYAIRSSIPAVTHVDFSARVQSVNRKTNPRYWGLINTFKQRHGCPVLVNTSFNVRGEPVVCTPDDAYLCFMRTEMDYLVLGDALFAKEDQPQLKGDGDWREQYALD
ncbi:carbamoyltransferase [Desulfovibrio sp. OttesenSCG-928-I05]|nr:carbamoyltransferase [Desulfovibrio sp. OttesenSCG-928-I05]